MEKVFIFHGTEGDPTPTRGIKSLCTIALNRMEDAQTEWSDTISRWDDASEADAEYPKITLSKKLVKKCVEKWLLEGEGDKKKSVFKSMAWIRRELYEEANEGKVSWRRYDKRISLAPLKTADIPRCFNCSLPIAVIKRCAGCKKTRCV